MLHPLLLLIDYRSSFLIFLLFPFWFFLVVSSSITSLSSTSCDSTYWIPSSSLRLPRVLLSFLPYSYFCFSSRSFIKVASFSLTLRSLIILLISDLYRFLIMCSVLFLYSFTAILAHFVPFSFTSSNITKSYCQLQSPFFTSSFKWFCHRSLHCLGVLKN
jgi:hypothetical protein